MNEPVVHTVVVRAPPDHAFQVFHARIDAWWPRSHRRYADGALSLAPHVGGAITNRGPLGADHQLGEVVAWQPAEHLAYL